MLTFLFWNTGRKNLSENIARLVAQHKIDVIVLAECPLVPGNLLQTLNASQARYHYPEGQLCPRIQIYTSFPTTVLEVIHYEEYSALCALQLSSGQELILVATHMVSQTRNKDSTVNRRVKWLADTIREFEATRGHSNTLLMGDLNLNPFDPSIIASDALHGVSTKKLAEQRSRRTGGRDWPFLYNPMWRFFSDATPGPPGTYFYRSNDEECFFWNVFDQVLLRPSLLPVWNDASLQILTTDGVVDFWTEEQGIRKGDGFSDHLPLLFRANLSI
jgi:exonuclease III